MVVAPEPQNLASCLRRARLGERVAVLFAAALAEALGAAAMRDADPAAAQRLTQLLDACARQAATGAVNKLVFEVLAALDEEPALRAALTRLHPELGLR